MNRDRDHWLVPLTGVGFIALVLIGFAVSGGDPPDADSPVQEIVNHYTDEKDAIQLGAFLTMVAAGLLLFFAAYLRKVLRVAEGGASMLPSLVLVGATIMGVAAAIDQMISFALAETADDIEPAAVQALQALWDNDFLPFLLGSAIFLLASGLSIVLHGVLPKWLGWVAVVLGVLAFTPIGFIAFPLGALWILVASVMLALRARGETTGTAGPAAPAASPGSGV